MGTEEATGSSDLYYGADAIRGSWEIMILMEFIGDLIGDLTNLFSHFKILLSDFLSGKAFRRYHHLLHNNCRH